jgi:inhibitor of cysteine peptidase
MKHVSIITYALLGIFLITAGAGAEVTVLRLSDSGKEIQVRVGALIELALEEQGGTGFIWEFDRCDGKRIEVVHTETRLLADQTLVGGPVLRIWKLKTKTPGITRLSLDYLRPWEGRAKAVKHFEVNVRIQ